MDYAKYIFVQNSVDDNYYAVYLENGQAKVQIGTPHGLVFLVANGTRYDDGKYHAIRFVKKNSRKGLHVVLGWDIGYEHTNK